MLVSFKLTLYYGLVHDGFTKPSLYYGPVHDGFTKPSLYYGPAHDGFTKPSLYYGPNINYARYCEINFREAFHEHASPLNGLLHCPLHCGHFCNRLSE
jgi:hypothetical protein